MSVPKTDGGGTTTPSTTTTASGPSKKVTTSTPSTTTTTAPGGPRRGTNFNRRPVEDQPGGDLNAAARRNALRHDPDYRPSKGHPSKPTPSKSSPTKPKPAKPVAAEVEEAANERRGRATSNDGRADNGVTDGHHVGARDVAIAELKKKQEELKAEKAEIAEDIGDIKDDIKGTKDKAGIVGSAVDIATAPVTAVFGLFHHSNPVSDAVKSAAEHVMGLEDKQQDLETKQDELSDQEQKIADEIDRLEDERTLNFLADVAHVTKMPKPVQDVLEGSTNLDIKVVDETSIGSDAAYDRNSGQIIVDDDVLAKVQTSIKDLRDDNIVDADGNIIDSEAFDTASAGDTAIAATALIGVHEVVHGSQDLTGKLDAATEQGQQLIAEANRTAHHFGGEDHDAIVDSAKKEAELLRIGAVEYDAYVSQETIELQAGKKKKVFTTLNPDGSLLPKDQAVENIYQLQLGLPMLHGVSEGQAVGGGTPAQGQTQGGDQSTGGRYTGGDQDGGRYTGGDQDGGRYTGGGLFGALFSGGRYTGGDLDGGRYTGGDLDGGRYTGGDLDGGRYTGGDLDGGRYTGGDLDGGRYTGGDLDGGRYTGGDLDGGRYTGGDLDGGRYTGGDLDGGRYTGGDLSGGRYTGGDLSGGRYTGGDLSGGRYTGGDLSGGRYTGGDLSGGRYTGGDLSGGRYTGGDLSGGFLLDELFGDDAAPGNSGTHRQDREHRNAPVNVSWPFFPAGRRFF